MPANDTAITERFAVLKPIAWPTGNAARELFGYALCSAAALITDLAVYSFVIALSAHYMLAASLGWIVGVFVAYGGSTRFVFRTRQFGEVHAEFTLFAVIGICGLLLTEILLWLLVGRVGMGALPAKAIAACATFVLNFGLRKALLFSHITERRPS